MERRLAAILAADVVGYSRLMGHDEAGTLAALTAHREELCDPEIARHNGRIVKLMGDGALVEFASVVDAVQCALTIQHGMRERNADVPDDRRIFPTLTVARNLSIAKKRTRFRAWSEAEMFEIFTALEYLLDRECENLSGGEIRIAANPDASAVSVRGRGMIFDPRDLTRFELTSGGGQHGV